MPERNMRIEKMISIVGTSMPHGFEHFLKCHLVLGHSQPRGSGETGNAAHRVLGKVQLLQGALNPLLSA